MLDALKLFYYYINIPSRNNDEHRRYKMQNVITTLYATESQIENAVFDAARANGKRETKTVRGLTVDFVEITGGHVALVKDNGLTIGSAMVDEFDC